ncbi:hypothetical protein SAMN02990966_04337 [Rhodospirillales bacterium URHD0017]|nr:hypothetical protein SAMN02990966_04337 [Rhodospirillales bacterium URHD0017]
MVRDERGALRAGAIACIALFLGGFYLVVTPRPSPAAAGWHAPAEIIDPVQLDRRAEAALERWRPTDEIDDEPANYDNAEPIAAYDGHYAGMVTTRADGRVVTIKLKVSNGIGSGTQSQRECGIAPITLKVTSTGNVTGLALMFSSTCLKTEMAIRGRAIGSTLQLRLGNQYLELSRPND